MQKNRPLSKTSFGAQTDVYLAELCAKVKMDKYASGFAGRVMSGRRWEPDSYTKEMASKVYPLWHK